MIRLRFIMWYIASKLMKKTTTLFGAQCLFLAASGFFLAGCFEKTPTDSSPVLARFKDGSITRHRADFRTEQASILRDVASLVGARPGSEILVAGRKAPYGHELWLPLMSFFVKE